MKKVINHKGWLTAILSIIPFFIFVSFFQGFGVGLSNVLGKRGIIDFDFDKYLEIEDMRDFLVADTIIQYFDLIGVLLLLWVLMRFVDKEPFINLDPLVQSKVREWLKEYVEKGGTVFINTHLLENAERLCDRAAIIHQGKIQSLITLKDLRKQNLTLEKLFHEIVV